MLKRQTEKTYAPLMKISSLHHAFLAILFFAFLSVVSMAHATDNAAPGSLRSGDLVGICGDSITEQKLYSLYIADYLLMCQPQPKLSAIQFGWGGERAPGFLARMKNDALVFKPTVVTTCYGMNDGGYAATTTNALETYRKSMIGIVETFKAEGVRFIVIGTPGVVDTFSYKGRATTPEVYNQTLADFGQAAKEVAEQEGVGFADVHSAMMEVMAKAKAANGPEYAVAGPDGVHPHQNGHLIMAYAFLKGLGCDGNIGTITVDLKTHKAVATEGTTVVSCANGSIELESTRYPFCFTGEDLKDPKSTRGILPFLPFNRDLNRYMLVVKNSPAKSLKVSWGTQNKTFSSDDLAKGINLAAEFLDNPFSIPFATMQQKIADQQAFETTATKALLHSLLDWTRLFPETTEKFSQLPSMVVAKWQTLREASAAAVVPVKHTIKIEAAP